ncbi:MAG: hypothetical protein OMM_02842 [Candidatus Magnetoglobus multicellularis str. Araruama]|uniref:G domain-containing protein n=1 Tax=Candidatus Magnetoglobus multicellularis str. Araruama TaxID=890399 RepID=A0A1V1P7W7_9BACT|nr:MAG: hypothetical protein OMM_02842 [Candidatus Magnetoglobus multicellularis str. Araruama]
MFIYSHQCATFQIMNSQNIKQSIQQIKDWSQDNVLLPQAQKDQFASWCTDQISKLEQACQSPLKMGLIGGTGVGKSTIINRLAGEDISLAHKERPYTQKVVVYVHQDLSPEFQKTDARMIYCQHNRDDISHLMLFDFPDYDSHLSDHRHLVQTLSKSLDIIVWVATPEKYGDQAMIHMMSILLQSSKNYCFVLNKVDQLQYDDIAQIVGHWHMLLGDAGIVVASVFPISALSSDYDDSFAAFQKWLFQKRKEHELLAITQSNIEHQIEQKMKHIQQQIDCQKVEQIADELDKVIYQLTAFEKIDRKIYLKLYLPMLRQVFINIYPNKVVISGR